jgi:transcription elongation factor Elf1
MNHNCPACGEATLSHWRKFVAGTMLPVPCPECGSIVEVIGTTWKIVSFALDILLIFTAVWALVTAINDPLYGASLLAAFVLSWLALGLVAIRLGILSVGVDNRFRDSAQTTPAGGVPRLAFVRFMSLGGWSSMVCGAWIISLFGLVLAMGTENTALTVLCFAILVFSGSVMRRLSPVIEKMHSCPHCSEYTISSWRKLFRPVFRSAKCTGCGAAWRTWGAIMGWIAVILQMLLYVALIASLYFGSFLPIILFGVIVAGTTMFDINFVPIVERRKKTKASLPASPPQ